MGAHYLARTIASVAVFRNINAPSGGTSGPEHILDNRFPKRELFVVKPQSGGALLIKPHLPQASETFQRLCLHSV